jgi:hypothetical protein
MSVLLGTDAFTAQAIDLASEADSLWFQENPNHKIRLRYPNDGDLMSGPCDAVLVVEVERGIRVKLPAHLDATGFARDVLRGASYCDYQFFPSIKTALRNGPLAKVAGEKLYWQIFRRAMNRGAP